MIVKKNLIASTKLLESVKVVVLVLQCTSWLETMSCRLETIQLKSIKITLPLWSFSHHLMMQMCLNQNLLLGTLHLIIILENLKVLPNGNLKHSLSPTLENFNSADDSIQSTAVKIDAKMVLKVSVSMKKKVSKVIKNPKRKEKSYW